MRSPSRGILAIQHGAGGRIRADCLASERRKALQRLRLEHIGWLGTHGRLFQMRPNRRSGAGGRTARVDRQIAELTCRFAVACFCSSMLLFLIVTCCRSNERKTLGGLVLAGLSACSFCHCHTKMRLLELFSGTKLVDGAFEALGWEEELAKPGSRVGCELRQVWVRVMSNQCGLLLEVTDLQLKTYEAAKNGPVCPF
eukprot:s3215_g4.t1